MSTACFVHCAVMRLLRAIQQIPMQSSGKARPLALTLRTPLPLLAERFPHGARFRLMNAACFLSAGVTLA